MQQANSNREIMNLVDAMEANATATLTCVKRIRELLKDKKNTTGEKILKILNARNARVKRIPHGG